MNMKRILVAEDAEDIRLEMMDYLKFYGFKVYGTSGLQETRDFLSRTACDALILDLGLPDGDGMWLLPELRAKFGDKLAVIICSARSHVEDRIGGITEGADAYLVKPVDLRELRAILRNVFRRQETREARVEPDTWVLDLGNHCLTGPSGGVACLTGSEVLAVQTLIKAEGALVDRKELILDVYQNEVDVDHRRLDTMLSRIRKKIIDAGEEHDPIKTFRGQGFAFRGKGVIH